MIGHYWATFVELICTPFQHGELVWGIVPLYFGLLLNEMTSVKASYQTAIQSGFSFLWASAQWFYAFSRSHGGGAPRIELGLTLPVNLFVTIVVFVLGLVMLICGLRRKFPKHGKFLGQTRFANYFMIAIFPIQAHFLLWTWDRVIAIAIFGLPVWLLLHFGLMPMRNRSR